MFLARLLSQRGEDRQQDVRSREIPTSYPRRRHTLDTNIDRTPQASSTALVLRQPRDPNSPETPPMLSRSSTFGSTVSYGGSSTENHCSHRRSCRICSSLKRFIRNDEHNGQVSRYFGHVKVRREHVPGYTIITVAKPLVVDVTCRRCQEIYTCPQCLKLTLLMQIDVETLHEDEVNLPMEVWAKAPDKSKGYSSLNRQLFPLKGALIGQRVDWYGQNVHAQITWSPLPERQLIMIPSENISRSNAPIRIRDSQCVDVKFMQLALRRCEAEHVKCVNPWQNAFEGVHVPILLMDLKERCIVASSTDAPYVTLSYVWGDATDTFECRRESIAGLRAKGSLDDRSFFSAPQTILDAMDFAEAMGERYIWIDRYCIVQDDHGQKASQILSMAAVYAKARFTIIAADGSAKDGLAGWPSRMGEADIDFTSRRQSNVWYSGREVSVIAGLDFQTAALGESWVSRGWTFQEQIFSRRAIVFHGGLSFWKCQRCFWQEDFRDPTRAEEGPLADVEKLTPLAWPDLCQLKHLLEKYALRILSYPSDSLHAFSGISSFLQPYFPGGFLFGLPEMWFDVALLWQPKVPLQDRVHLAKSKGQPTGSLPSWSWARWKGALDLHNWAIAGIHCIPEQPNEPLHALRCKIMPIVKWTKSLASKESKTPILNNFAMHRKNAEKRSVQLPRGWTRRTTLDMAYGGSTVDRFFHASIDSNTGFMYPIPLASDAPLPRGCGDDSAWLPAISGKVMRMYAQLGQRVTNSNFPGESPQRNDCCCWAQLLASNTKRQIGMIVLNVEDSDKEPQDLDIFHDRGIPLATETQYPWKPTVRQRKSIELEMIAISRGTLTWPQGDEHSIGTFDDWEFEQSVSDGAEKRYEYYNVMWIERLGESQGIIAERRGLGRIQRAMWEELYLDQIDITLR
ncbi:HET-domain-containing protein [Microthyrium microscopicum]|uniref:HET-domain-containing protein n=1 Tax=Microthyrium microscopicum TaxID=703497 RepID=A0A6A6UUQ7_9PEZI|nr:HET-domain-containing protein [Microthyrium microscopicum]